MTVASRLVLVARRAIRAAKRLGERGWRVRSRVARWLGIATVTPIGLVLLLALFTTLPSELREPPVPSLRVRARGGQLLREVRTDDGARARPLPLAAFPRHARDALLAAEDRRFYAHVGVDPWAIGRAAALNVRHGRVVSGASTITMQLARTVRPHRKNLWGKLTEMALALRIEASLSKDEILEQYLNRVTYGPNLRGYAAASVAYLGTPPESLSLSQAALIAGLPRGPSLYQVTKRPDLARRRRDRVLERMASASMIDEAAKVRAIAEPIARSVEKPAFGAPHLVRALAAGRLAGAQEGLAEALADRTTLSEITTTIDPELQRAAESAVSGTLAGLKAKHVTAASVVVIENVSGDVLAWVGSPDFYDEAALGQNDGVLALRQPGSALKPFVYAEAMTSLGYTGATILPDIELHIPLPGGGEYVPHDFDLKLRGPTRLREALGNSLNVPAVHTVHRLGTARVLDRLHAFGFASLTQDAEHYGPALALGDGEVTLLELANAYATLARGGVRRPVRIVKAIARGETTIPLEAGPATTRAVDERVAAMITDILSDRTARFASFGDQNVLELDFDVAAKTGTSKGYRDNVAVGFTQEVTVAVWVGNFDGSAMANVGGITGAGPIFHSVIAAAHGSRPNVPLSLAGNAKRLGLARSPVCSLSGEIATSACPHRVYEWLAESDADHAPACGTHARVRIDVRNGLRAGPGCGPDTTTERVYERWADPYEGWAAATGRPTAPASSSPECPIEPTPEEVQAASSPRVAYPLDGSRFVIDPERPASLQMLEVRIEPDTPGAEVRIDGALLARTRAWTLSSGAHTIVVTAPASGASPPVHFVVR